ncbi:MAG: hypothetical protein APF78_06875 [Sphingomonadales bacterium BRH_c3]|nr:MAG: hypothetical protein APF78_06875 [Sphingomonadales bacterium BRH_c3]
MSWRVLKAEKREASADKGAPDIGCECWTKPVPPHAHRLVTGVDIALDKQIFNLAQTGRVSHMEHHRHADGPWR